MRYKPNKTNPNDFPPGYTQEDEDRHQSVMRRLHYTAVITKILFACVGLYGVYLLATTPPTTVNYERAPNDTPLQINK
jgi:hypothetical protein